MRTESVSAVDASAAQRFGWADAAIRLQPLLGVQRPAIDVLSSKPLPRMEFRNAANDSEIERAARFIDALPVKLDARDGGMLVSVRLR